MERERERERERIGVRSLFECGRMRVIEGRKGGRGGRGKVEIKLYDSE